MKIFKRGKIKTYFEIGKRKKKKKLKTNRGNKKKQKNEKNEMCLYKNEKKKIIELFSHDAISIVSVISLAKKKKKNVKMIRSTHKKLLMKKKQKISR